MSIPQGKISTEQKRAALEQVLDSKTFARADQLRRFLRYICDMEISGRAPEISEYSIATEALGRAPGYTPGDDSSVRGRAHALRQKLQEYYESEQPDAPLHIELRKGTYVPVFVDRTEPPRPAPIPAPAPPQLPVGLHWWRPFAAGALVAGLLAATVFTVLPRREPSLAIDPVVREAWGAMVNPRAEVVVCIGSPPALLLKSFKEGTLPPEPRLMLTPKQVSDWYAGLHEADGGGNLYMQTTMNTVLSGDALAAVRAVRFLTRTGAAVRVQPEWGTRPLGLRGRNLLLIGSPNYSPYAARILRSTPFSVRYDGLKREEVISDGPPDSPQAHVYRPKRDNFGELTQVWGLLTVLPSQTSAEEHEQTVVFSGITSAGPQAAMEFFVSASSLRELRGRLAKEGHAHLPAAYQVVVRCGVDRALALSWAYETHRVIDRVPSLD